MATLTTLQGIRGTFFFLELRGIKAELEEMTTGQGNGGGRGGSERRRGTRSAQMRERAEEGRGT